MGIQGDELGTGQGQGEIQRQTWELLVYALRVSVQGLILSGTGKWPSSSLASGEVLWRRGTGHSKQTGSMLKEGRESPCGKHCGY